MNSLSRENRIEYHEFFNFESEYDVIVNSVALPINRNYESIIQVLRKKSVK